MEIELPEPDGFLGHGAMGAFLAYTPTASNPQEALYTEAKVRAAIAGANQCAVDIRNRADIAAAKEMK